MQRAKKNPPCHHGTGGCVVRGLWGGLWGLAGLGTEPANPAPTVLDHKPRLAPVCHGKRCPVLTPCAILGTRYVDRALCRCHATGNMVDIRGHVGSGNTVQVHLGQVSCRCTHEPLPVKRIAHTPRLARADRAIAHGACPCARKCCDFGSVV